MIFVGTGKLENMSDMSADVIGLDWGTTIQSAKESLGPSKVIQGNVDPMILFAPENVIRETVKKCIDDTGGKRHILNVGHGVAQGTPEENVGLFCQLARESGSLQEQKELAIA